jgi:hypothetical protein
MSCRTGTGTDPSIQHSRTLDKWTRPRGQSTHPATASFMSGDSDREEDARR